MNGRDDGNESQSGFEEEGGGGSGSVQDNSSASNDVSSELMAQSPPTSPRATQSPLMFAPQVSFHLFNLSLYLSMLLCLLDNWVFSHML